MKITYLKIVTGIILSFFVFSSNSNASEWSIGGILSNTMTSKFDTNNRCFVCKTNDSTAKGIYLSYRYSEAYGLEVGHIDLGEYSSKGLTVVDISGVDSNGNFGIARVSTELSVNADVSASYIAATATYQMTKKLSATGRLGIASLKQEKVINFIDFQEVTTISDSNNEAIFGASLDYSITNSLKAGLRVDGVGVFYGLGLNLQMTF